MDPVTTATLLASLRLQFPPLLVLLIEWAATGVGSLFQLWIRGLNIGILFAFLFGELGSGRVTPRRERQSHYIARSYKEGVNFDTLCWAETRMV